MIETIFNLLMDWTIRWSILALLAGIILLVIRRKNAHLKLLTWTIVLASGFLVPLTSLIFPSISLPLLSPISAGLPGQLPLPLLSGLQMSGVTAQEAIAPLWMQWSLMIWALVGAILIIRLLIGYFLTQKLFRSIQPVMPDENIFESDLIHVPLTSGIIRPRILLPESWKTWDPVRLKAVLAHEGAHQSRRDPLMLFAASLFRAVLWFHPLSWWLRSELNRLAEDASDDVALSLMQNRTSYAEILMEFIQQVPENRVQWQGLAMASRSERAQRMERILDDQRVLSHRLSFRRTGAILAIAVPLIYGVASSKVVAAQANKGNAVQATEAKESAYSRWVNQDVVYIIKDEEKAAFNRLETDAEREKFIEQFWKRRDPSPSTEANEFKTEHYRRIASVNERFSFADVAGWRSNRGRIYILYGPPDEIEVHPSGSQYKTPKGEVIILQHGTQQWRYRSIEGIGTNVDFKFIDSNKNDEYRMIATP